MRAGDRKSACYDTGVNFSRERILLLGLLALWLVFEWPNLEEQVGTTEQARAALGEMPWQARTAALDTPGYAVAEAIGRVVPASGCVLVLAHTGPEHARYYQSRFSYYLYPRQVRLSDHSNAEQKGCTFLAVFRDTAPNLAQEPFRGRWEEAEIAARTAGMKKVAAAPQVEIFQ